MERISVTPDLASFCEEQHPRLVRLLALYCNDPGVGEELAQETIAVVIRDWRKVREADSPEGWACRTALNLANSVFRRRGAERRALLRTERVSQSPDQSPGVIERAAIRDEVARLPKRQRTALLLRYVADLSLQDTAVTMDCAPGTVKALCHQAIKKLRSEPALGALRGEIADA